MLLNDLDSLNKPGVFALISPVEKKVYLGVGVSMLKAITRLLDDLKKKNEFDQYNLSILETCKSNVTKGVLSLKLAYWVQEYTDNGYAILNSYKGVRLNVHAFLSPSGLVHVEIVSSSNKRVVVGVFKSVREADEFIARHYSRNIKNVVYADNRLTDRYKQGLKILL